jgi:hypothetical protein
MNIARLAFFSFLIFSLAFATCTCTKDANQVKTCKDENNVGCTPSSSTTLEGALQDFCLLLYGIVGQLAFVMVVLSSVVFTAGQFFGAEARARMAVWANSMLIGAITGILMVILVPWFLGMLIGTEFDAAGCTFK